MPKGAYDREASAWTPTPRKEYPLELVQRVRNIYESGSSMKETSEAVGVTVKVLQRLMPRHGIQRRRAIKRDQTGPNNDCWKGDSAGYDALHRRVVVARGRASQHRCTCGANARHWANQTGRYQDIADYLAMCISCHYTYDAARRRETGRPTMPTGGIGPC